MPRWLCSDVGIWIDSEIRGDRPIIASYYLINVFNGESMLEE